LLDSSVGIPADTSRYIFALIYYRVFFTSVSSLPSLPSSVSSFLPSFLPIGCIYMEGFFLGRGWGSRQAPYWDRALGILPSPSTYVGCQQAAFFSARLCRFRWPVALRVPSSRTFSRTHTLSPLPFPHETVFLPRPLPTGVRCFILGLNVLPHSFTCVTLLTPHWPVPGTVCRHTRRPFLQSSF
jgi:hypothetical protein